MKASLGIYLMLAILTCNNTNGFWQTAEVELRKGQQIHAIYAIDKERILIGGNITNSKIHPAKRNDIPFTRLYSKGLEAESVESIDFRCNDIYSIFEQDGNLFCKGMRDRPPNRPELPNYIYDEHLNRWDSLRFPPAYSAPFLVNMANKSRYVCATNGNHFGVRFYETIDGGQNWKKRVIMMANKRDEFYPRICFDEKYWGLMAYHPDEKRKSLLYIDLGKWERGKEYPLDSAEMVIEMKEIEGELFALTYQKQRAQIKRVDVDGGKLIATSEFILKENETPSHLYLFNDYQIVVTVHISGFFPEMYLRYKKEEWGEWRIEPLPKMAHATMSFNNGRLIGVFDWNKIYFRDFK